MSFIRTNSTTTLLQSKILSYCRYCEGGDLLAQLNSVQRFPEPKAARIFQQILSAIDACHSKNIVHRDLKLENILFEDSSADSTVKIIDFGQSKWLKSKGESKGFMGSVHLL